MKIMIIFGIILLLVHYLKIQNKKVIYKYIKENEIENKKVIVKYDPKPYYLIS